MAKSPPVAPFTAALKNWIVLEVKMSVPVAEKYPDTEAAWAEVKLPTAKTVSAARRFSIGGLQVKKVFNVRECFSHY